MDVDRWDIADRIGKKAGNPFPPFLSFPFPSSLASQGTSWGYFIDWEIGVDTSLSEPLSPQSVTRRNACRSREKRLNRKSTVSPSNETAKWKTWEAFHPIHFLLSYPYSRFLSKGSFPPSAFTLHIRGSFLHRREAKSELYTNRESLFLVEFSWQWTEAILSLSPINLDSARQDA